MSSIRWSVPPHVRLEETGDAVLILDATRGGVHRLVGPSAVVIRAAMSPEGAAGLTGEELAAAEALETEGLLVRSGGREVSRRTALTAGAAAALGITTLMLPAAAVASSVEPLEADFTEDIGDDLYSFWVFASPGTTTFVADGVPSGDEVDVLVVGGGGGGAGGALVTRTNTSLTPPVTNFRTGHGGGGGGGGGFLEDTLPLSGGVQVIVGSGGVGGAAGNDSADPNADFKSGASDQFTWEVYLGQNGAAGTGSAFGSVTAGGGSGGEAARFPEAPTTFTVTWGGNTAPGGDGGEPEGGAGGDGDGNEGAPGGEPEDWFDQTGGSVGGVSGGGGGGATRSTDDGGSGADGGGDGGDKGDDGEDAAPNRGGGGGGGAGSEDATFGPATAGGRGGDGIVIVRYPSIPAPDPV